MTKQSTSLADIKQGAVAKPKPTTIQGFLEAYKGEIARALPKHMTADRMARIALTEFRKTPALMNCDPATLFGAVIQCAQLGLEPGGSLGHAYLLPFENRKKGITEVQFIIGYRGMIDLARRSGQIVSLEAHAVYEGDKFDCQFGLNSDLTHVPDWNNANRVSTDKLRFVYAVAKLKDGGTQFEVMSRAEVDAVRGRSKASNFGPWQTDYAAMALKTVIRRLFKYLPVSIEMSNAVTLDEKAEVDVSQGNAFVIEGVAAQTDDASFVSGNAPGIAFEEVEAGIKAARTPDQLDDAANLIGEVADAEQRAKLGDLYVARKAEVTK